MRICALLSIFQIRSIKVISYPYPYLFAEKGDRRKHTATVAPSISSSQESCSEQPSKRRAAKVDPAVETVSLFHLLEYITTT